MSFNKSFGGFFSQMPPATKHILGVNVVVWIACLVMSSSVDLVDILGMHYVDAPKFAVYQVFTYMFVHDTGSISHIFFNMFSLLMFGALLERVLGTQRYLVLYLVGGIGAALLQQVVWMFDISSQIQLLDAAGNVVATGREAIEMAHGNSAANVLNGMNTIGASGCVLGLLMAFAMIFPNMPMYLFFIPIPIKAKWMVLGYGLIELMFGVTGTMASVSHFGHLGGLLAALLLMLYWRKKGNIRGGYY